MFWIILIVAGALLIKLGAFSVLVTVLSVAFKAAIVVIAAMGLLMLWLENRRHYSCDRIRFMLSGRVVAFMMVAGMVTDYGFQIRSKVGLFTLA